MSFRERSNVSRYTPLSVREGGWRKKAGWQIKEARHRLALALAPWLADDAPTPWAYEQACKALWRHRTALDAIRTYAECDFAWNTANDALEGRDLEGTR